MIRARQGKGARRPGRRSPRRHRDDLTAVIALAVATAVSAPADARSLDVSAPLHESPGGTVPAIVTAYGVPPRYGAAITASGTGGAVARCVGDVWLNRVRASASRKCYLHLPNRRGTYNVVGRARLTRDGHRAIALAGRGSRPIRATGYRSARRMPLERIRRIERCFNDTNRVWLTFDDGGNRSQVLAILATLGRNNVRGRFFFTGAWASGNAALMRRIRRHGHLVGNHSQTHAALSQASRAEVAREITRGTRATTIPKLLRPPFAAGALTTRLEALAAARGYRLCRWTTDTYDWHGASPARMAERVRHGDYLTPPVGRGGNILMHASAPHTARGLQSIIDAVRSKGLALDRLPRSVTGHSPRRRP